MAFAKFKKDKRSDLPRLVRYWKFSEILKVSSFYVCMYEYISIYMAFEKFKSTESGPLPYLLERENIPPTTTLNLARALSLSLGLGLGLGLGLSVWVRERDRQRDRQRERQPLSLTQSWSQSLSRLFSLCLSLCLPLSLTQSRSQSQTRYMGWLQLVCSLK